MRLRIKFTKMPPLTYIGHLDLMRYFQKVLRRANIPVAYSKGFNPHMQTSFALPLGVGVRSIGEYLDVELDNDEVEWIEKQYLTEKEREGFVFDENKMSLAFLSDIGKNLNKESVGEVYIKGLNIVPQNKKNKAMSLVAYADYIVAIPYETTDIFERDGMLSSLEELLNDKIVIEKKTKGGVKEIDFTKSLIEYRLASVDELVSNNRKYNYFKFMDSEENHKVFKDSYINDNIDEYFENEIASEEKGNIILFLRTKAGSDGNLNPSLVIDKFYDTIEKDKSAYHIYRLEMYDWDSTRLLNSIVVD